MFCQFPARVPQRRVDPSNQIFGHLACIYPQTELAVSWGAPLHPTDSPRIPGFEFLPSVHSENRHYCLGTLGRSIDVNRVLIEAQDTGGLTASLSQHLSQLSAVLVHRTAFTRSPRRAKAHHRSRPGPRQQELVPGPHQSVSPTHCDGCCIDRKACTLSEVDDPRFHGTIWPSWSIDRHQCCVPRPQGSQKTPQGHGSASTAGTAHSPDPKSGHHSRLQIPITTQTNRSDQRPRRSLTQEGQLLSVPESHQSGPLDRRPKTMVPERPNQTFGHQ